MWNKINRVIPTEMMIKIIRNYMNIFVGDEMYDK